MCRTSNSLEVRIDSLGLRVRNLSGIYDAVWYEKLTTRNRTENSWTKLLKRRKTTSLKTIHTADADATQLSSCVASAVCIGLYNVLISRRVRVAAEAINYFDCAIVERVWRHMESYIDSTCCLQGGPKKWTSNALHMTSSNIGRFSKFFHCYNLQNICNAIPTMYIGLHGRQIHADGCQIQCSTIVWTKATGTMIMNCLYCRDGGGSRPSQFDVAARCGSRHRHLRACTHSHPHCHRCFVLLRQQLWRHHDSLHSTVWPVAGTQQGEDCWGGWEVRFTSSVNHCHHHSQSYFSLDEWMNGEWVDLFICLLSHIFPTHIILNMNIIFYLSLYFYCTIVRLPLSY